MSQAERAELALAGPTDKSSSEPGRAFTDSPLACPRCAAVVEQRFYGPCESCRRQLAASQAGQAGGGGPGPEAERYEPKMNVVPNQVATKE